jgi:uncharacterized protein
MKTNHSQYALITGASGGIGKSLATACAQRKMNLILVALRNTGLETITQSLKNTYNIDVQYFECDLTIPNEPQRLHQWVLSNHLNVKLLVNNAGIGYEDSFENLSIEFCENLMRLNMQVVVVMTRLFIPELKKSIGSSILNVSSLASFSPMPYKSLYAASKSFVYSFSRAVCEELKKYEIGVSVLCPGPVPTNQDVIARINRHGIFSRLTAVSPDQVARAGLVGLDNNKNIIIPGWTNKLTSLLLRSIPQELRIPMLSKKFQNKVHVR